MNMMAQTFLKWCDWGVNAVLPGQSTLKELVPVPKQLKTVAIITPFFLGDTILASVLLQNIIRQLPAETRIIAIGARGQLALWETLPRIETLLAPPTQSQKQQLLKSLQCDAVFLLRYSLPWAMAIQAAKIQYRVGFGLQRLGVPGLHQWGGLLTHPIPSGTVDAPAHQLTFYRQMLLNIGWQWDSELRPHLELTELDKIRAVQKLEPAHSPRIVIHATAGSPGKRWRMMHWVRLVQLLDTHFNASLIALGTPSDYDFYTRLQEVSGVAIHNLCGNTALRESAAICGLSDVVITLDTAIAHLAAAVEAPNLVVLYGPTNVTQWKPVVTNKTRLQQVYLEMSCRPCITRTCYHRSCLRKLSAQQVFDIVRGMITAKLPVDKLQLAQ